ncbi:MAG: BamA/TamA family outer membrane protein [Treponema sp.]|nr:BamA/TamA family outer membrane protein [Treponema sp.]
MFRNRFPLIFIFAACLLLSFSPLFSQTAHAESVSADSEPNSSQSEPNSSQSEPVSAQPVITEIKITGLKKTKPAYMQQVLEKYKGVPITQIDLDEVETTLQAEGLFSESEAEITRNENGELILSVTVTEKISFIPLPFLSYSSSTGFMGGLMLMDTNAFGVKDQYIVGGIFSGSMQMGVMSFSKPSLSRTKPGFSINGSFMHRDNTFQDTDEKTFLEYENIGASATFSITDKITEHASVNAGIRYNYMNISYEDEYAAYENELETYHAISLLGGWGIKYPVLNEWFLSTKSARLNGELIFLTSGKKSWSLSGQIVIQQQLPLPRFRLLAQGSVLYTRDLQISQWQTQNAIGTTILPAKFHAPQLAGSTLGLEIGVLKTKVATISVYGQYELAMAKDRTDERTLSQGYSAGAKMYLSKIAFPAMAFGLSHNVTKQKAKFSVAFGMGF